MTGNMKKCPFCGADIEENARFCLYCMTSLTEKTVIHTDIKNKKRWLFLSVALLLFLLVFIIVLLFGKALQKRGDKTSGSEYMATVSDDYSAGTSQEAPVNSDEESDAYSSGGTSDTEVSEESSSASVITDSSSSKIESGDTVVEDNESSDLSDSDNNIADSGKDNDIKEPTYTYRNAQKGDDWDLSYNIPQDAIVITGVSVPSEQGKYVIPEKIDGKTVVAVMQDAFCKQEVSDTVKTVVVPSTVKTIWSNAFGNCYNLTDIYIYGNIHIDTDALPDISRRSGTITIHCSSYCNDRNFRLYKNIAKDYGAVWSEWVG